MNGSENISVSSVFDNIKRSLHIYLIQTHLETKKRLNVILFIQQHVGLTQVNADFSGIFTGLGEFVLPHQLPYSCNYAHCPLKR